MAPTGMHRYGQDLRAIGQDLEAQHIKAQFYVECRDDEYLVWAKAPEAKASRWQSVLKRMHRLRQPQAEPQLPQQDDAQTKDSEAWYIPGSNWLRYQPEDLERLEREGEAKRQEPNGTPDPYRLPQLLRTLGNYMVRRNVRFLTLSWSEEVVGLVYETAEGQRRVESLTLGSIYDLWVHMYLKRRNTDGAVIQVLPYPRVPRE